MQQKKNHREKIEEKKVETVRIGSESRLGVKMSYQKLKIVFIALLHLAAAADIDVDENSVYGKNC